MNWPLYILLMPLIFTLIFFSVLAISAIYHIFKFEFINLTTTIAIIVFLLGTFFILTISWHYLRTINWQEKITINLFNNFLSPQTPSPKNDTLLNF